MGSVYLLGLSLRSVKESHGTRLSQQQSNVSWQLRSFSKSHFWGKCAGFLWCPRYLTLLGGGFPSRVPLVGCLMLKASRNQSREQIQFPDKRKVRFHLSVTSFHFCLGESMAYYWRLWGTRNFNSLFELHSYSNLVVVCKTSSDFAEVLERY